VRKGRQRKRMGAGIPAEERAHKKKGRPPIDARWEGEKRNRARGQQKGFANKIKMVGAGAQPSA